MEKPLLKKLLLNLINDGIATRAVAGCNDLFDDDPLLKGLTEEEIGYIKKELSFNSDIELLGLIEDQFGIL